MDEVLMSIEDVAEKFGWSVRHARYLCRIGVLPHVRVGRGRGTYRFRTADIDAYINKDRGGGGDDAPPGNSGN